MTEAMQMVRDTLGDDAVIVATREERGGSVHVTAAIEPGMNAPNFEIGSETRDGGWLQYDSEQDESAVAEELTEAMLRHAVPEEVMDHILSCATVIGLENPGNALVAAIEHLYGFKPLQQGPHNKAFMVVGPPGSGKTLVAAKMATRAALQDMKVGVITTDTVRAGGVEQLQAFTKLLQIDLQMVKTPKRLEIALQNMQGYHQIIIDTAGLNPFDQSDVKTLANFIGAGNIEPVLALPAGGDAEESGEMARVFASLGAQRVIPTRIDIARRLGGLLSAAHQGQLAFADAGNTAKVADGLTTLSPEKLARLLMPEAYPTTPHFEQPSRQAGTAA